MQKRGALARIGVTLLNVLAPGIGLLRLGKWKQAVAIYGVGFLFLTFVNLAPPASFALFAGFAAIALATYPISMVMTWILGSTANQPKPWFARWYSVVGAVLIAFLNSYFLGDKEHVRYRSFSLPAGGMAPTLLEGDKFFAYMRKPKDLRRGDLLLVRASDGSTYVKRLAGLPGDVISVVKGVVVLNGKPVAQQFVGAETFSDYTGPYLVRRLGEQLPGEAGSHEIYDLGQSAGDNAGPFRVRPNHIFLLGDNRDRSADSRFSHEEMGLKQVPMADILGWPLFHNFGSSRPMGNPINRRDMQ